MVGPLIPREEWRPAGPSERLEMLLGRTLSEIEELLEYPMERALRERDAVILNAKIQAHRAVLSTCMKLGIERNRALQNQSAVLDKLSTSLRERLRK